MDQIVQYFALIDFATQPGPTYIMTFESMNECLQVAYEYFVWTDELGSPVCVELPMLGQEV